MKKYRVTIVETLSRTIDVSATDATAAYDLVETMYLNESIVLGSEDFDDVDFITFEYID
jgi:hypothetical protein